MCNPRSPLQTDYLKYVRTMRVFPLIYIHSVNCLFISEVNILNKHLRIMYMEKYK